MNAGASAAVAAAAAIAQATKASGVIIRVEPEAFLAILRKQDAPLVVQASGGFLSKGHQYLASYKGLAFYCKSGSPIPLPAGTELVLAEKIWVPG